MKMGDCFYQLHASLSPLLLFALRCLKYHCDPEQWWGGQRGGGGECVWRRGHQDQDQHFPEMTQPQLLPVGGLRRRRCAVASLSPIPPFATSKGEKGGGSRPWSISCLDSGEGGEANIARGVKRSLAKASAVTSCSSRRFCNRSNCRQMQFSL